MENVKATNLLTKKISDFTDIVMGPVVQSRISANPGLKFNPLFWFVYFCTSVNFQNFTKENSF